MPVDTATAVIAIAPCVGLPGWPEAKATQDAIIDTLARLSRSAQHAQAIVSRWMEQSRFSPTPHDLYQVAEAVRADEQPEFSTPRPRDSRCPFAQCTGDGWVQGFYLHTHERGQRGGVYIRKEKISEERYKELSAKVDWQTQFVYEGVRRCPCSSQMQQSEDIAA